MSQPNEIPSLICLCLGCKEPLYMPLALLADPASGGLLYYGESRHLLGLCDGCDDLARDLAASGIPFDLVLFGKAAEACDEVTDEGDATVADLPGNSLFVSIYRGMLDAADGRKG